MAIVEIGTAGGTSMEQGMVTILFVEAPMRDHVECEGNNCIQSP